MTRSKAVSLLAPFWLVACLLLSGWFLLTKSSLSLDPPKAAAVQTATTTALPTRAIERLRVGQRLPARNPDLAESERSFKTAVDPKTWRLVKLRAEARWDDGTLDVHNIETLQPLTWIAKHKTKIGATVPIPLDLVEIGSPADLRATVVGIEPCPPIADGPGQVILSTVDHLNRFVFRLTVKDDRARRETVGVTGFHKVYSKTRKTWVDTKDLRGGESLGYLNRPVTVAGLQRLPGTHRVYNLTVEGEHVYYVSALGALVHNAGCGPKKRPGTRGHADHQADVNGPGKKQAQSLAKPGETVLTERPVQGHPGINRRADNQIIGKNGKTRLTVESERRPNGSYHKKRVKQLEDAGIEVQTRPLPKRPK